MKRLILRMTGCALLCIAMTAVPGRSQDHNNNATPTSVQIEPTYLGKPFSYWNRSIHNRDSEVKLALAAVRTIGPDADDAVPELTRIVAAPFSPVRIGVDKDELILSKLLDMQLRADAIDALGAIGEAAAPSSAALIRWALTTKVVRSDGSIEGLRRFVDLAIVDVFERMRVAGAIAQFGRGAFPEVLPLLSSTNDEERKFGVAILSENTLPLVATLLKSADCQDRRLGILILGDMWPVVPKEHLSELKRSLACDPDERRTHFGARPE